MKKYAVMIFGFILSILAIVGIIFGCDIKSSGDDTVMQQAGVSSFDKMLDKTVQAGSEVPAEQADSNETDGDGPTVVLFHKDGTFPENRLTDFMYFVPLISPVPLSVELSENNQQAGHLLSYHSDKTGNNFSVSCEFRMKGTGHYVNTFDSDAMIEWNMATGGKKKALKNILDYIKFEGTGYGRIEAKGIIEGPKKIVEHVEVVFNARDEESPVTIGLYDTDLKKMKDGSMRRYNHKVARITTLIFERSERAPRLDMRISAVGKDEESLGAWEHIKAFFGNFFIDPIQVDKLGNDTMLKFGLNLYNKEPVFTFPAAKNLKKE
jgi:hypothetical protein